MILGWVDWGGGGGGTAMYRLTIRTGLKGFLRSLVWNRVWQNQMAFGAEKGTISLKIDHCH